MSQFGISALTTSALVAVKSTTVQRVTIQAVGSSQNTLITVDASLKEVHSQVSTPSKFPIEDGTNITDNFMVEPAQLELTGIISDNNVNPVASLVTSVLSTVLPPTGIIAGSAALAVFNALNGPNQTPSVTNFNQFLTIIINKQPVNVTTTLQKYYNMWLSSISVDRDAQSGNALMFKAHFVQVILVKATSINIGNVQDAALSSSKANLGAAGTSESSILSAIFNKNRLTGITSANTLGNAGGLAP